MAKEGVTPDDNIGILLSAIKQLSGKIDFGLVAKDCNIVTAGAAAKRYSRLLKAHGVTQNKNGSNDKVKNPDMDGSGSDCASSPAAKTQTKKRKAAGPGRGKAKNAKTVKHDEDDDGAEVEGSGTTSASGDDTVKEEPAWVKSEPDADGGDQIDVPEI
ncbi:hypothetical protein ANO11243_048430 [Dothideomycetidae sp. 11243]|nr:hypothetical protein ANO11243_048430 [fungal sp. No.11243]